MRPLARATFARIVSDTDTPLRVAAPTRPVDMLAEFLRAFAVRRGAVAVDNGGRREERSDVIEGAYCGIADSRPRLNSGIFPRDALNLLQPLSGRIGAFAASRATSVGGAKLL